MGSADLRQGVSPATVLDRLREVATQGGNVLGGGIGEIRQARDRYLQWVENSEAQLRSLFADAEAWSGFYTDHYWQIRLLDRASARPYPLINDEARRQVERLEALAASVRHQAQIAAMPTGSLALVADTSVLMHYQRLDQIDWVNLASAPHVALVLPLLIVDELDDLKFRDRPLAKRASSLVSYLRNLRQGKQPWEPVSIRQNVDLRILMDPVGHRRRVNNDEEILDRTEQLNRYASGTAALATGDYGMELRASTRELRCIDLPDDLRLPSTVET